MLLSLLSSFAFASVVDETGYLKSVEEDLIAYGEQHGALHGSAEKVTYDGVDRFQVTYLLPTGKQQFVLNLLDDCRGTPGQGCLNGFAIEEWQATTYGTAPISAKTIVRGPSDAGVFTTLGTYEVKTGGTGTGTYVQRLWTAADGKTKHSSKTRIARAVTSDLMISLGLLYRYHWLSVLDESFDPPVGAGWDEDDCISEADMEQARLIEWLGTQWEDANDRCPGPWVQNPGSPPPSAELYQQMWEECMEREMAGPRRYYQDQMKDVAAWLEDCLDEVEEPVLPPFTPVDPQPIDPDQFDVCMSCSSMEEVVSDHSSATIDSDGAVVVTGWSTVEMVCTEWTYAVGTDSNSDGFCD